MRAEAEKQSAILRAEAHKEKMIREAEGFDCHHGIFHTVGEEPWVGYLVIHNRVDSHGYVILCDNRLRREAEIQNAMERQMKAERERREAVTRAEGEKKANILVAEVSPEAAL